MRRANHEMRQLGSCQSLYDTESEKERNITHVALWNKSRTEGLMVYGIVQGADGGKSESPDGVFTQLIPMCHETGMGGGHCDQDSDVISFGRDFISRRLWFVNLPVLAAR